MLNGSSTWLSVTKNKKNFTPCTHSRGGIKSFCIYYILEWAIFKTSLSDFKPGAVFGPRARGDRPLDWAFLSQEAVGCPYPSVIKEPIK